MSCNQTRTGNKDLSCDDSQSRDQPGQEKRTFLRKHSRSPFKKEQKEVACHACNRPSRKDSTTPDYWRRVRSLSRENRIRTDAREHRVHLAELEETRRRKDILVNRRNEREELANRFLRQPLKTIKNTSLDSAESTAERKYFISRSVPDLEEAYRSIRESQLARAKSQILTNSSCESWAKQKEKESPLIRKKISDTIPDIQPPDVMRSPRRFRTGKIIRENQKAYPTRPEEELKARHFLYHNDYQIPFSGSNRKDKKKDKNENSITSTAPSLSDSASIPEGEIIIFQRPKFIRRRSMPDLINCKCIKSTVVFESVAALDNSENVEEVIVLQRTPPHISPTIATCFSDSSYCCKRSRTHVNTTTKKRTLGSVGQVVNEGHSKINKTSNNKNGKVSEKHTKTSSHLHLSKRKEWIADQMSKKELQRSIVPKKDFYAINSSYHKKFNGSKSSVTSTSQLVVNSEGHESSYYDSLEEDNDCEAVVKQAFFVPLEGEAAEPSIGNITLPSRLSSRLQKQGSTQRPNTATQGRTHHSQRGTKAHPLQIEALLLSGDYQYVEVESLAEFSAKSLNLNKIRNLDLSFNSTEPLTARLPELQETKIKNAQLLNQNTTNNGNNKLLKVSEEERAVNGIIDVSTDQDFHIKYGLNNVNTAANKDFPCMVFSNPYNRNLEILNDQLPHISDAVQNTCIKVIPEPINVTLSTSSDACSSYEELIDKDAVSVSSEASNPVINNNFSAASQPHRYDADSISNIDVYHILMTKENPKGATGLHEGSNRSTDSEDGRIDENPVSIPTQGSKLIRLNTIIDNDLKNDGGPNTTEELLFSGNIREIRCSSQSDKSSLTKEQHFTENVLNTYSETTEPDIFTSEKYSDDKKFQTHLNEERRLITDLQKSLKEKPSTFDNEYAVLEANCKGEEELETATETPTSSSLEIYDDESDSTVSSDRITVIRNPLYTVKRSLSVSSCSIDPDESVCNTPIKSDYDNQESNINALLFGSLQDKAKRNDDANEDALQSDAVNQITDKYRDIAEGPASSNEKVEEEYELPCLLDRIDLLKRLTDNKDEIYNDNSDHINSQKQENYLETQQITAVTSASKRTEETYKYVTAGKSHNKENLRAVEEESAKLSNFEMEKCFHDSSFITHAEEQSACNVKPANLANEDTNISDARVDTQKLKKELAQQSIRATLEIRKTDETTEENTKELQKHHINTIHEEHHENTDELEEPSKYVEKLEVLQDDIEEYGKVHENIEEFEEPLEHTKETEECEKPVTKNHTELSDTAKVIQEERNIIESQHWKITENTDTYIAEQKENKVTEKAIREDNERVEDNSEIHKICMAQDKTNNQVIEVLCDTGESVEPEIVQTYDTEEYEETGATQNHKETQDSEVIDVKYISDVHGTNALKDGGKDVKTDESSDSGAIEADEKSDERTADGDTQTKRTDVAQNCDDNQISVEPEVTQNGLKHHEIKIVEKISENSNENSKTKLVIVDNSENQAETHITVNSKDSSETAVSQDFIANRDKTNEVFQLLEELRDTLVDQDSEKQQDFKNNSQYTIIEQDAANVVECQEVETTQTMKKQTTEDVKEELELKVTEKTENGVTKMYENSDKSIEANVMQATKLSLIIGENDADNIDTHESKTANVDTTYKLRKDTKADQDAIKYRYEDSQATEITDNTGENDEIKVSENVVECENQEEVTVAVAIWARNDELDENAKESQMNAGFKDVQKLATDCVLPELAISADIHYNPENQVEADHGTEDKLVSKQAHQTANFHGDEKLCDTSDTQERERKENVSITEDDDFEKGNTKSEPLEKSLNSRETCKETREFQESHENIWNPGSVNCKEIPPQAINTQSLEYNVAVEKQELNEYKQNSTFQKLEKAHNDVQMTQSEKGDMMLEDGSATVVLTEMAEPTEGPYNKKEISLDYDNDELFSDDELHHEQAIAVYDDDAEEEHNVIRETDILAEVFSASSMEHGSHYQCNDPSSDLSTIEEENEHSNDATDDNSTDKSLQYEDVFLLCTDTDSAICSNDTNRSISDNLQNAVSEVKSTVNNSNITPSSDIYEDRETEIDKSNLKGYVIFEENTSTKNIQNSIMKDDGESILMTHNANSDIVLELDQLNSCIQENKIAETTFPNILFNSYGICSDNVSNMDVVENSDISESCQYITKDVSECSNISIQSEYEDDVFPCSSQNINLLHKGNPLNSNTSGDSLYNSNFLSHMRKYNNSNETNVQPKACHTTINNPKASIYCNASSVSFSDGKTTLSQEDDNSRRNMTDCANNNDLESKADNNFSMHESRQGTPKEDNNYVYPTVGIESIEEIHFCSHEENSDRANGAVSEKKIHSSDDSEGPESLLNLSNSMNVVNTLNEYCTASEADTETKKATDTTEATNEAICFAGHLNTSELLPNDVELLFPSCEEILTTNGKNLGKEHEQTENGTLSDNIAVSTSNVSNSENEHSFISMKLNLAQELPQKQTENCLVNGEMNDNKITDNSQIISLNSNNTSCSFENPETKRISSLDLSEAEKSKSPSSDSGIMELAGPSKCSISLAATTLISPEFEVDDEPLTDPSTLHTVLEHNEKYTENNLPSIYHAVVANHSENEQSDDYGTGELPNTPILSETETSSNIRNKFVNNYLDTLNDNTITKELKGGLPKKLPFSKSNKIQETSGEDSETNSDYTSKLLQSFETRRKRRIRHRSRNIDSEESRNLGFRPPCLSNFDAYLASLKRLTANSSSKNESKVREFPAENNNVSVEIFSDQKTQNITVKAQNRVRLFVEVAPSSTEVCERSVGTKTQSQYSRTKDCKDKFPTKSKKAGPKSKDICKISLPESTYNYETLSSKTEIKNNCDISVRGSSIQKCFTDTEPPRGATRQLLNIQNRVANHSGLKCHSEKDSKVREQRRVQQSIRAIKNLLKSFS